LLYDLIFKYFKGKLYTRWIGPYQVDACYDNGTVILTTIDWSQTSLITNEHHFRLYRKPNSSYSFIKIVSNSYLEVVGEKGDSHAPPTTYFDIRKA